jgi:hypothetical protein
VFRDSILWIDVYQKNKAGEQPALLILQFGFLSKSGKGTNYQGSGSQYRYTGHQSVAFNLVGIVIVTDIFVAHFSSPCNKMYSPQPNLGKH